MWLWESESRQRRNWCDKWFMQCGPYSTSKTRSRPPVGRRIIAKIRCKRSSEYTFRHHARPCSPRVSTSVYPPPILRKPPFRQPDDAQMTNVFASRKPTRKYTRREPWKHKACSRHCHHFDDGHDIGLGIERETASSEVFEKDIPLSSWNNS